MHTPAPEEIAVAFDLGAPLGELVHVRRGDNDAWRLETSTGSYFVKGYFPTTGGQFNGEHLSDQLAVAMAFERRALQAGVDMPEPITPTDPFLEWAARIQNRLFRVHRWIEPGASPSDVSSWLGRTMFEVHRLEPLGRGALPDWWRQAALEPATWQGWLIEAQHRDASWADLYRSVLPDILAGAERIAELCIDVPDLVTTHGDFKPHNLVSSVSGTVLVDWDSVRTDSAALEAARTAYIFAAGNPAAIQRILTAYQAAGGELCWPAENLFLSVTRNHLQVLADHLRVALDGSAAARWMGGHSTIDAAITTNLQTLRAKTTHLTNQRSVP